MKNSRIKIIIACCWFALSVTIWLVKTRYWPFFGDSTLIRYVVLNMGHHYAPYRQIQDINMPGAYLLDWLTLRCLGPGSTALRIYDSFLLAVITAAMSYISGPRHRALGFCGGCLFALFHARDGFQEIGQRDLALAALLLVAVSLAIRAEQSHDRRPLGLFGLTVGIACTVKPIAIVFLLLLLPLVAHATRKQRWSMLGWVLLGCGLPCIPLLGFLQYYKAFHAFTNTLLIVIPFHAKLGAQPLGTLLRLLFSTSLAVWTASLLLGWTVMKCNQYREKVAGFAVMAGFLCYLLQMRGYNYHRYPFAAAIIVSLVLILPRMLNSTSWLKVCGIALVLYCAALCPLFVQGALSRPRSTPQGLVQLQIDLKQLPDDATYQCIDSIGGCIDTLVHLNRPQVTREMYDEFLFHDAMPGLLERNKSEFLIDLMKNPPSVVIVTMGLFPETTEGYQKLSQWPTFNQWLSSCYLLTKDRFFPPAQKYQAIGYRIYQRSRIPCPATVDRP